MKQYVIVYPLRYDHHLLNLTHELELLGFTPISVRQYLTRRSLRAQTSAAILNWYEDFWSRKPWKNLVRFCQRQVFLSLLMRRSVPIVYVVHNRRPHESYSPRLFVLMRRRLLRVCHAVAILSKATMDIVCQAADSETLSSLPSKTFLTPLANTAELFHKQTTTDWRRRLAIADSSFVYLFTGSIRPYKNIELIIELAEEFQTSNRDAVFVIQGTSTDALYVRKLQAKTAGLKNLRWITTFVSDERLPSLFNTCNVVILPYSLQSSLNSGTCISAFSNGRNVIAPSIGTIQEVAPELTYSYSYREDSEHYRALHYAAIQALDEYQADPESFKERQYELRRVMLSDYSLANCSQAYGRLFDFIRSTRSAR